jgi:hypothetical protein
VFFIPIRDAYEAKLVPAEAGHVVAALRLLDEHAAGGAALPVLEVPLEVGIAGPVVLGQHALAAELSPAGLACEGLFGVDDALAVLVGAHAQTGVADGLLPEEEAAVALLVVFGEGAVAGGGGVQYGGAVLLRAGHFLIHADLVHEVVVQTPLAELVLAVTHSPHLLRLIPGLAELADAAGEGAAYDDVLEVEFLHFLM